MHILFCMYPTLIGLVDTYSLEKLVILLNLLVVLIKLGRSLWGKVQRPPIQKEGCPSEEEQPPLSQ